MKKLFLIDLCILLFAHRMEYWWTSLAYLRFQLHNGTKLHNSKLSNDLDKYLDTSSGSTQDYNLLMLRKESIHDSFHH